MPEPTNSPDSGEVTRLLQSWRAGDETAADRLFPLVYQELRRAAEAQLRRERPGHTLQATALVHEVYLKLAGDRSPQWENRGHFLGIAARAMRQLLVDHARRRNAAKRGGGQAVITLGDAHAGMEMPVEEVIALDDALTRLDAANPRLRQVVELRFFAGLTEDETARALGVTTRTTQRDWVKARAWLYKELYGEERREE